MVRISMVGINTGKRPFLAAQGGRTLPDDYLSVITRGRGYLLGASGERFPLKTGDAFFCPAGCWHCFDPNPTWDDCWILFDGAGASNSYGDILPSSFHPHPLTLTRHLLRQWQELKELSRLDDPSLQVEIEMLLHEVLFLLFRQTDGRRTRSPSEGLRPSRRLMQHWALEGTPLDLEALAREEQMSYEVFRHLFRRTTGSSPKQYFLGLKITIAQEQLLHTAYSVKKIASALGYQDPGFFSRLFSEKTGMSPSAWRRQPCPARLGEKKQQPCPVITPGRAAESSALYV